MIDTRKIAIDMHGAVVLSDEALKDIEAEPVSIVAAASTNGACSNESDCDGTTNSGCVNWGTCSGAHNVFGTCSSRDEK